MWTNASGLCIYVARHHNNSGLTVLELNKVRVQIVRQFEEKRFVKLMQLHHYLGALPKISETIWYKATLDTEWVALVSFSAPALKCRPRDRWIGWDFRHQYDRLKLVTNNSRFLILPEWHARNLASRTLSLCQKRIQADWQERFGHPILLLETFVDPRRFYGTIYRASNWVYAGDTKGFHRTRQGYSNKADSPKMVFLKPLVSNVQALLTQPVLKEPYLTGGHKIMLSAEHMKTLPDFFTKIPDPRRAQGRRHRLSTVLAISTAAILCGMRGYLAIFDWADALGQKARERFRCRYENGRYVVPSLSTIRDVLVRVNPLELDKALQGWNQLYADEDESLAIDGKTMCNAIDDEGYQTHVMSVVGHQTKNCYTQKKSDHFP